MSHLWVKKQSELRELILHAKKRELREALLEVIHFRPADDDIVPPRGVKQRLYGTGNVESHASAATYNQHADEVYAAIYLSLAQVEVRKEKQAAREAQHE